MATMTTALAIGLWLPEHISVTLTPSLDHRIFFLQEPGARNFKVGDYLLFKKRLPETKTDLLIKQVGCAPGQTLAVEGEKYLCDEAPLGRALLCDSKGNHLPAFVFNGLVPSNSLFMIGSHLRSYDSRYFGFVDANTVLKKAYPLW